MSEHIENQRICSKGVENESSKNNSVVSLKKCRILTFDEERFISMSFTPPKGDSRPVLRVLFGREVMCVIPIYREKTNPVEVTRNTLCVTSNLIILHSVRYAILFSIYARNELLDFFRIKDRKSSEILMKRYGEFAAHVGDFNDEKYKFMEAKLLIDRN